MKKLVLTLLSILLVFTIVPLSATGENDASVFAFKASALSSSGSCGDNVNWSFDSSTGKLTISGRGKMKNYTYDSSPFYANTSIKTVIIEKGVTSIGDYAFRGCSNLKSVTIPDSVTSIGSSAFSDCSSLKSVTIPDSVTSIGDWAFYDCSNLKSVTIPDSVTSIGGFAFSDCNSLTSVTIPDSVTRIGDGTFRGCSSLKSITIPNSVTSIGYETFSGCSNLKSVTIPDSVTRIGDGAFYYCSGLTSVTIPDSVTSIGNYAFRGCSNLKNVTIPRSVTSIGDDAFDGCSQNLIIYGYVGTTAERYAYENNISFIDLSTHTHSYTATVTKPATCTAKGTKTKTCSTCGNKVTATIAATGHTYKTTTTKATTSKSGSKVVKCEDCGYVKSKSTIAKISSVKLSTTSYTYNGKTKTPTVTVKDSNGKTLKNGTDYKVKYSSSSRKNVGTYTVTVTFKGNYSGTKKLTFKIVPKSTSISKLTAGKKSFTAKWSKQSTQTTGYQIQYSTSSKMTNATTKTISKNSTTSQTISGLKSSKTYYVRIRTYKTVNGSKIYSSWSSVKSVKVK